MERCQRGRMVGAETGDPGVAGALEQCDRLGLPADGLVLLAEGLERDQGVVMVGAGPGDLGVADALVKRDRIGVAAGVRKRQGLLAEGGQRLGVFRTERAFEPLGGRFGHLQDRRVPRTPVVQDMRELALIAIHLSRSGIALALGVDDGPQLRFGFLPGG